MIKLYTLGCPHCKELAKRLKKAGVIFEERSSLADMEKIMDAGFKSVPVLELEDGEMIGYEEALKRF